MLSDFLHKVVFSLCQCTLDMIKQDDVSYPEFREGFFKLVMNIIKKCTDGYFQLTGDRFQTIVYSVIFAFQHEKLELMELGLETMHALTVIILEEPDKITPFYVTFYTKIIHEIIRVMTDYKHTSGFKMQATILMNLLQVVSSEQNFIGSPINDQNGQPHKMGSNKEFVSMLLKTLLCQMFPNLNEVQVEAFIIKMFNTAYEWTEFKQTLRDLLISMKSFSSQSNELYEDERKVRILLSF